MQISKYRVQYQNAGENYWETLTSDKKEDYEYKRGSDTVIDKNAWKIIIPTINEEFFNNSTPIVGEDGDEELLNIKIRIVATKIDSDEKNHTIVKRKETVIKKLELSNAEVVMPINATRTITATPTTEEEIVYYAKTNGNYYKIEKNAEGKYIVQEDKTEIRDEELTLSTSAISNVNISIDQATKVITLNGIAEVESELTVTYGVVNPKSAKCNIKVLSDLDYIEETDDLTGYTTETVTEDSLELELDYPIAMGLNDSNKIKVTTTVTSSIEVCYVLIDGKYYNVQKNGDDLTVGTMPYDYDELHIKRTLEASSNDSTIVKINGAINQSLLEIPIASGNKTGIATITVSYGVGCTKTCDIEVKIMPTSSSVPNPDFEFIRNYGTIDVIWLDTDNNVISEPNKPNLYDGELTPVSWTYDSSTSKWSEDETTKDDWYSYNAISDRNADGTTVDNSTSNWANAKNSDGSYFVWIPRYAYRITYYESETSTTPTGYYDGWGLWNANDATVRYALDSGIETVSYNGDKYIVHPAFETNLDNGGWSNNLTGFWTAKYEMSQEKDGVAYYPVSKSQGNVSISNTIKAVSKPNVKAWRYINIGNMYLNSYNYDRNKESHLMKNSEWGAISYLTHSQYGRNGNQIDCNNNGSNITGNGAGATEADVKYSSTNEFNTIIGAKASSTGNVYGIFDLSGSLFEFVACFNKFGKSSYIEDSNATSMTVCAKDSDGNYSSTKYITVYQTTQTVAYNHIETGLIGDATKEIGTKDVGSSAWFDDFMFAYTNNTDPFIKRGADSNSGFCEYTKGGLFRQNTENGAGYNGGGYRVVLCPPN